MKLNRFLKLPGHAPTAIEKDFFTVGYGAGYDAILNHAGVSGMPNGILFSVRLEDEGHTLYPADHEISINGHVVTEPTTLQVCDRIEWNDQAALYLDELLPSAMPVVNTRKSPVQVLSEITGNSAEVTLSALIAYACAEAGSLICEVSDGSEWVLLANQAARNEREEVGDRRKHLVSHTILAEAIKTKEPVYIESIIGHRWEAHASILEAQVFSVACIPLLTGERVFGALFLYTRTPGRSILRTSLDALRVVATQTALLHSAYKELSSVREENRRLNATSEFGGETFVFDKSHVGSLMHAVSERIGKLASHDLSILIRGETGTGKELVAREIHRRSPRAKGPFVALNCAAIPPTLIESLLFGYAKGAFTGANKDREGKFVQANGGTIFLDEIGDLPADLQTKLLRVLQEKEVEPVGADRPVRVDIRVLSATHQDLEARVEDRSFRSDLYYRLKGAVIAVPPLRERGPHEIEVLAQHLLSKTAPDYTFSAEAQALLQSYDWPGNVRELGQAIQRAVALSSTSEIQAQDLELESLPKVKEFPVAQMGQGAESLKATKGRFTQQMVKQALDQCDGNRLKAAELLGISERTLYRLLAADRTDSRI